MTATSPTSAALVAFVAPPNFIVLAFVLAVVVGGGDDGGCDCDCDRDGDG